MKKSSINNSEKMIIIFAIKAFVSSVLAVFVISGIISELLYKLDLDFENSALLSLIIYIISSIIVTVISVSGFKNNGVLLGIISQLPLILFSLFNLIFNDNTLLYFVIKLIVSITVGAVVGTIRVKKNASFKV